MGTGTSKAYEPIITKRSVEAHKQMTEQMLKKEKPDFEQLMKNEQLSLIFSGLSKQYGSQLLSAGTTQFEFAKNAPFVISWNSCKDTAISKEALYNRAQNILNLALCYRNLESPSSRICNLLVDMSLRLLDGCQEVLMGLKPDLVFQGWTKIYALNNDKSKQSFFAWFANRKTIKMMERYGMKVAAELISEQVATGKVYDGKSPLQCKYTDIMIHLLLAAMAIIEKDLQVQEYQERTSKID